MQPLSSGILQRMKPRRRRYFLPGTSQPRLLLTIQLIMAFLGVLVALALYLLFDRDLTNAYFSAHLTIRNVREMLLPTLIAIDVAVFLASVVAMIFFTHRIAGPAYRLGKTLRALADGEQPPPVRLRKGDYLTELAEETNRLLQAWEAQRMACQREIEALSVVLEPALACLSDEERLRLQEALTRLKERVH